jgi:hypothetical protein
MIGRRKKEAAPCSLDGAVTASFKLDQNNILTQFSIKTSIVHSDAQYKEENHG